MIVATAGHIDHGKTLLVKRLTGVDTDRLPEEKARGISIDLGFAYLPFPGGTIGFVDVPGHERFIRNMLAGVCGIDFALLIVAADDGIMPQTIEHANILELLNVARGAAVITKIDRVDEARVKEVSASVRSFLEGTKLATAPVLPVSAVTGAGIEPLQRLLEQEAAALSERRAAGQRSPIKLVWSREDDVHGGYYRPMHVHRVEVGFDAHLVKPATPATLFDAIHGAKAERA